MKKIFFGWYIVIASLLLMMYNSVLFVYGFTAFMTPITTTMNWTKAQVSFASSLRGLETGALDPFVGAAADRWPARRLMFIGIAIIFIGVVVLSQAANLALFYVGFLIVGLGSAISISVVPTTVVARWFKKNIGKASGVLATGIALGGMFTPLIVMAVDAYGWQNTLLYLGFGMLVIGFLLSLLFRNRPEDHGLLPDGQVLTEGMVTPSSTYGVTLKEALRMKAFWFIGVATMFQMMAMHAVTLHMMPHLENVGMERETAALAVTIFSFVTIGGRLLYGVLADIFMKKYVMASALFLTAIGLALFHILSGDNFFMVVVFAVIYGLGAAGNMPLRTPLLRDYFGVKKFGTIFGVNAVFMTVGVAVGAPLAGYISDMNADGSYSPIWLVYAGLVLVSMVLMLIIPKPRDLVAEQDARHAAA